MLQINQKDWQPLATMKPCYLLVGKVSEAGVNAKGLWSRREESVIGSLVRHHIRY